MAPIRRGPPRRRALALSVFTSSIYMGTTISTLFGGLIAFRYGWRVAMIAAAVPGLLLAGVLVLTVREPQRGRFDAGAEPRTFSFGRAAALLPDQVEEWCRLGDSNT